MIVKAGWESKRSKRQRPSEYEQTAANRENRKKEEEKRERDVKIAATKDQMPFSCIAYNTFIVDAHTHSIHETLGR